MKERSLISLWFDSPANAICHCFSEVRGSKENKEDSPGAIGENEDDKSKTQKVPNIQKKGKSQWTHKLRFRKKTQKTI